MKSIAIAVALLVATGGAAHAFTYDGAASFKADGTPRFTDPDDQLTTGPKSSKPKSGFSMNFGTSQSTPGAFGLQNRFLPSANPAFSSPFQQRNPFAGGPFGNN